MLVGNTAGYACMIWQEPGGCFNYIILSGAGESPWKVTVCDAKDFNSQYTNNA